MKYKNRNIKWLNLVYDTGLLGISLDCFLPVKVDIFTIKGKGGG